MNEERIHPVFIREKVTFPLKMHLEEYPSSGFSCDRFVAITLTHKQALLMHPILSTNCILIVDRHSTFVESRTEQASNLYAIRYKDELLIGYAFVFESLLVLRYSALSHPIRLLSAYSEHHTSSLVIGRICGIISIFPSSPRLDANKVK